MNALHTSSRTVLIAFAIVNALAMGAARAAQPVGVMQIDCRHRYVSQADAARLFGTHNVSRTFARRQTLYADLARACAGKEMGMVTLTPAGRRSASFARPRSR